MANIEFETILTHVNSLVNEPVKLYSLEYNPYLHTTHCKALLAYLTLAEAKPQLKSKVNTLDKLSTVRLWQSVYEPELQHITVMFMHNIMRVVRDDYCLLNKCVFNIDVLNRKHSIVSNKLDLVVTKNDKGHPVTTRYAVCRDKSAKHQLFILKDTFIPQELAIQYPNAIFRLDGVLTSHINPTTVLSDAVSYRNLDLFKATLEIFTEDDYQDQIKNSVRLMYRVYALNEIAPYIAAYEGLNLPNLATIPFIESLGLDYDSFVTHLQNINNLSNTIDINLPTFY